MGPTAWPAQEGRKSVVAAARWARGIACRLIRSTIEGRTNAPTAFLTHLAVQFAVPRRFSCLEVERKC